MGGYLRPGRLSEALQSLAGGPLTVLAGGTDYYPARVGVAPDDTILDITAIDDLTGIDSDGDRVRIGALVCWRDIAEADLPSCFDGLKAAARQIGGAQVQNAATICGNVCNASPAADGIPNLLVLDAEVELSSHTGVRRIKVSDFVTGNRETARRPDELVTAILIPAISAASQSCFLKLGARAYLVISIAMVAGLVVPAGDGTIAEARLAVGACSPVARRLPSLEAALRGRPIAPDIADIATARDLADLSPIDDVRGSAVYRRDAALVLLRRALRQLGGGAA